MKKIAGGYLSVFSRFSKLTIFIALYIIISASFMFQLLEFLRTHIGQQGLKILVGLGLTISASAFWIYAILVNIKRRSFSLPGTLVIAMVLTMIMVLAWQIQNFAERIHIVEYAILGWFAAGDLVKVNKKTRGAISACLFCAAVGLMDEIFQWILPQRYFDLNDIIFNTLGGVWGTILYLITTEGRR